ncbi:hypothetical protein FDECE_314 [Fusarium decemcellulare]|nr:hypothetical protein FDECE_314 [Fusarium decemcellulare]
MGLSTSLLHYIKAISLSVECIASYYDQDATKEKRKTSRRGAQDSAGVGRPAAVVHKKRKAATSTPKKPPTMPAEHVNFYTPENSKFYSEFTYQDLKPESNSIRLLRIKPPTCWDVIKTEPIKCDLLDEIPLDSVKGKYTTLSYCAGSPKNIEQVVVDGICFNAFANLGHALRQARHFWKDKFDKRELLLWADQICINQNNPLERSHQVKLMRDIYSSCEQVLVSLSTEQCSRGGLSWLQLRLADVKPREHIKGTSARVSTLTNHGHDRRLPKGDVNALCRTVVGSSWWARAWIRQEFICSPDAYFMAAFESLHWLCLRSLRSVAYEALTQVYGTSGLYDEEQKFLAGQYVAMQLMDAKFHVSQKPTSFPDLLSTLQLAHSWNASDPRDLIYASFGVSNHSYGLCPDYSIDAPFHEVCIQLACNAIRHNRNLDILIEAYLRRTEAADLDWPSWVPDWRMKVSSDCRHRRMRGLSCPTNFFTLDPDEKGRQNRILGTRGIMYAVVGHVNHLASYLTTGDLTTGESVLTIGRVFEGDEVWILDGANQVILLRHKNETYELVGSVDNDVLRVGRVSRRVVTVTILIFLLRSPFPPHPTFHRPWPRSQNPENNDNSASPAYIPVMESGFSLSDGVFTASAGNVARVDGSRLRALFDPTSLLVEHEPDEAAEAAAVLSNKEFVAGQLKHYGIEFSSTAKLGAIREVLRQAVDQGKCDRVPRSVRRIEEALRCDAEQQWDLDWEDDDFDQCTTPGERAECDIHRFLDYYFLTNGNPDPWKTPGPLALHGYTDIDELHELVEAIPDLAVINAVSGDDRVVCVGWDYDAVLDLSRSISGTRRKGKKRQQEDDRENDVHHQPYATASRQRPLSYKDCLDVVMSERAAHIEGKKRRRGDDWENDVHHQPYATTSRRRLLSDDDDATHSHDLDHLEGSYVIESEAYEMSFWSSRRRLTLDIGKVKDGVLMAAYDFGEYYGTMVLSPSKEVLRVWTLMNDTPKRTLKQLGLTKRPKATPSLSRRLFFEIRGREIGEDVIFYSPESGHIDFLDDECTKFKGQAATDLEGLGRAKFSGYKVSDMPSRSIQPWSSFSEKAYDYESRARWRRR